MGINPEFKKELKEVDAKFIFDQAEKRLKETSDISQTIVARSTTLITLIVGMMVGLFGFLVNRLIKNEHMDVLSFTCTLAIVYLFIRCYKLKENITSQVYKTIGRNPSSLLDARFFKQLPADRIIVYYTTEVEYYEEAINHNRNLNESRWKRFNKELTYLIYTPVALLVCLVISKVVTDLFLSLIH